MAASMRPITFGGLTTMILNRVPPSPARVSMVTEKLPPEPQKRGPEQPCPHPDGDGVYQQHYPRGGQDKAQELPFLSHAADDVAHPLLPPGISAHSRRPPFTAALLYSPGEGLVTAACRRAVMASATSPEPNTADPATSTEAPDRITSAAVARLIPPSTSSS